MSSRKESLKKSLGISEYPWSSDDDELTSASTFIDVHILRRQPTEQQTSVADTPGTSGQPVSSSQNASPSRVSRLERDLYWSLADSRPTHTQPTMAYKTRPSLIQKPGEVREIRSDRPKLPTDIRRILAFKKFTRQLGNLAASKPNSNLYAMSSRGYAGTSRNPLFTPTLMTGHPALKRLQCSRNALRMNNLRSTNSSTNPNYTSTAETTATNGAEAAGSQILESGRGDTWIFEPVVVDEPPRADSADDVIEVPETTEPVNQVDENITTEAEPAIDVDTHDTSGGGVSLEEEIVEIDPPDYQDVPPSAVDVEDTTDNGVVNTDVGLNEAATGPVNEEAEALQEQSEANKRRDADDKEPNTVKEYNQSLLRLLECPVCLEWMEPPMSQCRRGHLVCGRCRARLAACPVCRTTFSSVRNRAMEGVAEMVRYPCRHGCGREVRLRRRIGHESSCGARRYYCPVPVCSDRQPLPRPHLLHHFQSKHMPILKIGQKHRFSMKVNSEQHDTWLITALQEYFYLRVDIDIRTWGVILYVAYIGPKCNANNFIYEVSVEGQHNSRRMVYSRNTHSDLESSTLNVSRQDCFHLTLDQALNFLRFKNRHCEPDKFLDFDLEITKCENTESNVDSDS